MAQSTLPGWARPLFSPKRYKFAHGGRGSSKSESFATALVIEAAKEPQRILCAREFQNSIRESVHATLVAMVRRTGLEAKYEWTEHTLRAKSTGSEFVFEGLHANMAKIKSMHGIRKCWVEEAETVSKDSWVKLIPTIRERGSEIWATFNPEDEESYTWQLTKQLMGRADAWVAQVNWRDNPWFPDELRAEMLHDFKVDQDLAEHVWNGAFKVNSEAQVFAGKTRLEDFSPEDTWDGPWYGLDFGFGSDPLSAHEYWAKGSTLYVAKELYKHKVELDDIAKELFAVMPKLRQGHPIRCDNSRPESISHLRHFGLNAVAAEKWPGSVDDGILYLRALAGIVIHSSNCPGAKREAKYYRYKVDKKTGKVLNQVVDAYNHFWDDCRYALQPAIRTYEQEVVLVHDAAQGASISPELDQYDAEFGAMNF